MSLTVKNLELEDTNLNELEGFSASTSQSAIQTSVAQYEANRENHDTEVGQTESEATDTDVCPEELYEEEYWEQSESFKNGSGPKQKFPSKCKEVDDNFITYRKTYSKDQKERQLNLRYKLDSTTTLLLEKLIQVRNIGPYHDAIAEGKNSIVIQAGETTINYSYKPSYTFKNAVKIYKLTDNDAKNKAIFQKAQREFDSTPHNPVRCGRNIIIMERIGTEDEPAVPITMLPQDCYSKLYCELESALACMYRYGYVHGRMSIKNTLYWRGGPSFVGWSHSVDNEHPNALKNLMKDCYFVTKFCKRNGVSVKSTVDLFKAVSTIKTNNKYIKVRDTSSEVLEVIKNFEKQISLKKSKNVAYKPSRNSRFK